MIEPLKCSCRKILLEMPDNPHWRKTQKCFSINLDAKFAGNCVPKYVAQERPAAAD